VWPGLRHTLSEGEGEGRARVAFGANQARLVELKNRYDPITVFRLNQNIAPTLHTERTG
jgi:hypothetical protein